MSGTLFDTSAQKGRGQNRRTQLPAPWRRVDGGSGKLGSRYAHPKGYRIEHCGHPTALWPYALYGKGGLMIMAPNGRAWRTLADIALAVHKWEGGQ